MLLNKNLLSLLAAAALLLLPHLGAAQPASAIRTDASHLTLVGKFHENTPNPYHRADTCVYNNFTKSEKRLLLSGAGIAVAFKTTSTYIGVVAEYGYKNYGTNTMGVALRGFDLYIKKNGVWTYANSRVRDPEKEDGYMALVWAMEPEMKECLLYLPMYSELRHLEIITQAGMPAMPLPNPFRHRVGMWGSSVSQGIGCSRSGMGYAEQFTRNTGIQILNFGTNGSCKLQDNFTQVVLDADMDALIMDCFTNPEANEIEPRLFPFIEQVQAAHPGMPIIFQSPLYRGRRAFDTDLEQRETTKRTLVEKLMKEACKKYKDVYYVTVETTPSDFSTTVDGTHIDDYGYYLWAKSLEQQVLKILKKYGIK